MVVIAGHGGYIPTYRIERSEIATQHSGTADGESTVPGPDENHVTMAAEAAELTLERAEVNGSALAGVFVASITDPLAEHGIAAQVGYRLGVTNDVRTSDFRSTTRAATDALIMAHRFNEAGEGPVLVVCVDAMPTTRGDDRESLAGAAAAAVLLTEAHDSPTGNIVDLGQATTGFVERHRRHYRPPESGDERFERRHGIIPATTAAVESLDGDIDPDDSIVVGTPDPRSASTVLDRLEIDDTEQVTTFDEVGYAGTASLLLDTVHCLETSNEGDRLLVIAYGAGGADAIVIETARDTSAGTTVGEQLEKGQYVTYAKHLEYRERILPAEVTTE